MTGKPLRIALPNKGRLATAVHKLFGDAGLHLDDVDAERALLTRIGDRYEAMFVRAKDIPAFVADGVADAGVTGWDLVCESGFPLTDLLDLGLGRARLAVAARASAGFTSLSDLPAELRVATSYPHLARTFLQERGFRVEVVGVSGATEIAPHLGLADVIVDVVATGSTLKRNGLAELETVLTSSARLLAPRPDPALEPLVLLLDSVVQARARRYVMANLPAQALDRVTTVLPGVTSPTVMPLLGTEGTMAVHAVIDESALEQAITGLRDLGGTGIVVTPIERLVR